MVRFRHLCSNSHLRLNEDGLSLTMATANAKENTEDWSTVFEIRSTAAASLEPTVKYDSRMLFKSATPFRNQLVYRPVCDPITKKFSTVYHCVTYHTTSRHSSTD